MVPPNSNFEGLSINRLVRLAEQTKCHGRLAVVDAITLARLVPNWSSY